MNGKNETIDILLVDDEPRNLDALEAILAEPAYRLLRAGDADTALRTLLENDVAAIVLDIKMPGVSGFELAKMIKNTKRFRETPIVFLTAYMIEERDVITGYGAGAVDYLTKPVSPEILRAKVAVFAELFRKTRALAELNATLEARVAERTAELERSEAALRAAAAQKDEFIAVLSHELRNPLAPLRHGLALLLRRQPPGAENTVATMNRQLDHMVRLVDDLLDISRISRGLLELQKEPVRLAELVRATMESVRPLFARKKHRLSLTGDEPIGLQADPTRVAQILTNLLQNAAKFTPEGGTIDVELTLEGDDAIIRVVDSGPGIAAAHVDQVFEMFARVNRPAGAAQPGLGIGLALGRRLATMHGGSLTAASDGPGRGTTFTLRLPGATAAGADVAAARPRDDGADGRARALDIVIVEDNDDVADSLRELLEEFGHQVRIARTGEEGLALVRDTKPAVVLCDLGLPGMDGLEVCRSIRALGLSPAPVLVALTGWGRNDDRLRTKDAGFDHHLVKPVSTDGLAALLEDVGAALAPAPDVGSKAATRSTPQQARKPSRIAPT
jgi:signal transduction histidine kinase